MTTTPHPADNPSLSASITQLLSTTAGAKFIGVVRLHLYTDVGEECTWDLDDLLERASADPAIEIPEVNNQNNMLFWTQVDSCDWIGEGQTDDIIHTTLVAEMDSDLGTWRQPIGYCRLVPYEVVGIPTGIINQLCVDPVLADHNLVSVLLSQMETLAQMAGHGLLVGATRDYGERFFTDRGYYVQEATAIKQLQWFRSYEDLFVDLNEQFVKDSSTQVSFEE